MTYMIYHIGRYGLQSSSRQLCAGFQGTCCSACSRAMLATRASCVAAPSSALVRCSRSSSFPPRSTACTGRAEKKLLVGIGPGCAVAGRQAGLGQLQHRVQVQAVRRACQQLRAMQSQNCMQDRLKPHPPTHLLVDGQEVAVLLPGLLQQVLHRKQKRPGTPFCCGSRARPWVRVHTRVRMHADESGVTGSQHMPHTTPGTCMCLSCCCAPDSCAASAPQRCCSSESLRSAASLAERSLARKACRLSTRRWRADRSVSAGGRGIAHNTTSKPREGKVPKP